jgi:hypothetical protein
MISTREFYPSRRIFVLGARNFLSGRLLLDHAAFSIFRVRGLSAKVSVHGSWIERKKDGNFTGQLILI